MNKNSKNLLGKRFGYLSVESFDENFYNNRKNNQNYNKWICRCDCGEVVSVISSHLLSGNTTKCKKCKLKNQQINGKFSKTFYLHIRDSARKRNIEFNLSYNFLCQLFEKQSGFCAIIKKPIVFANTIKDHKNGKTTASLDRIDSSRGYTKGNVQWVHKDINKMKGKLNQKRFIELCEKISNYAKNN